MQGLKTLKIHQYGKSKDSQEDLDSKDLNSHQMDQKTFFSISKLLLLKLMTTLEIILSAADCPE